MAVGSPLQNNNVGTMAWCLPHSRFSNAREKRSVLLIPRPGMSGGHAAFGWSACAPGVELADRHQAFTASRSPESLTPPQRVCNYHRHLKQGSSPRRYVMRLRSPSLPTVLIALLVVTALATVLITPDPTDDVHAVMRPHRTQHAPAIALLLLPLLALLVAGKHQGSQAATVPLAKSLQLLCTCRC